MSKPFWNVFCHEAPAQWSSAHQHSHCGLRRRWLKSVFRDKANAPLHVNVLIRSTLDVHPKKRKGGLWKGRHWKEWLPGPILCTLLSWSELWRWTLNTAPDQIHLSKSIVHQMHLCSRMNAIRCLLDLVQWSSHFNFQRGFRLQTKGFFSSISGVLIIVIGSLDCHDMEKVHLLENCWTDKQFWLRSFVKKLWRWQRGRFQSSLDINAPYKREATSNIFNIQHIRMVQLPPTPSF